MTTKTEFEGAAFRRAFEEWDLPTLLGLYADDVELVEINHEHPPSAPRVRRGREIYEQSFGHCASAGVKGSIENLVVGDNQAAYTMTCEFPDGRKVVGNAIVEIRDGAIVRELQVQSGDA